MSQLEYVPLKFQPNVFYLQVGGTNLFTKSIEREIMHYNRSVLVEHIYLISYSLVSLPRFPSPRKKCVLLNKVLGQPAGPLVSSGFGRSGVFFKFFLPLCICINIRGIAGSLSFLY